MITSSRWQHILGVARKCKEFAVKLKPNNNKRAISTFMNVSWDNGIGDIIERKLGKTLAEIRNYEVMRNNILQKAILS